MRRGIEELQVAGKAGPPPRGDDDDGGGGAALRDLQTEAKELKATLGASAEGERRVEEQIEELALALPNLSSAHTPSGSVPEVLEVVAGRRGSVAGPGRSHVDIGVELDLLDFAGAAATTGWGWYYLKNEAVLLEQALVQYAYSVCLGRGWKLVAPPSIVYSHVAAACGFQPRDQNDEQQIYSIQQAEKDKAKPPLCLAATAEIPLAGMNAGRILQEQDMPLKVVAASRCYRAEAGARGVDTKGLYRVHEFTKVEMFAWTMPDDHGDGNLGDSGVSHSEGVFEEMLEIQIEILKALGLGFRVLEMPSTDLGASASRKKDIEVYFPSRTKKDDGFGEVTSASICTDYQSRRLATRVKKGTGQLEWPHTVNGTALAVPRVLAAVMEAGWNESDRTVLVPEVLRPWMGGMERICNTLSRTKSA